MQSPVGIAIVLLGLGAICSRLFLLRVTIEDGTIKVVNFFSSVILVREDVAMIARAGKWLGASGELSVVTCDGQIIPLQVADGLVPIGKTKYLLEMENALKEWLGR